MRTMTGGRVWGGREEASRSPDPSGIQYSEAADSIQRSPLALKRQKKKAEMAVLSAKMAATTSSQK